MPNSKLSKAERKLAKKQAKSHHTLYKHDGINTVAFPTPNILVANGGLGNGIERSEILAIFSNVGVAVEDIMMLREKPYCFLRFADADSSTTAMQRLQGYRLREGQGSESVTLYLSFVESVPDDSNPQSSPPPPGLIISHDFIDEATEQELIDSISWEPAENQSLKHRHVKHHGYEFNYTTNNVDRGNPLPGGMPETYERLIHMIMGTGHVQFRPDQLTINQYEPGQGIPPHVDTHSAFEDAIISLSLGSQVLMEFCHPDGRQAHVPLPRRSLAVMTGEARYLWTHGITPRKSDVVSDPMSPNDLTLHQRGQRTSFTFRAVRKGPCTCKYPEQCDSQNAELLSNNRPQVAYPSSEKEAALLETEQVHEVYDQIADHFSGTRYKPWPKVVEFLDQLLPGSIVLDVGCGNGKYLGVNKNIYMMGCDRSNQLIGICRGRGQEGVLCDSLCLPVGRATLDACICIAVIHHMSTTARRVKALQEMSRVLKPGGLGLVTVWAMEQELGQEKSKYIARHKDRTERASLEEDIQNSCLGSAVDGRGESCDLDNERIGANNPLADDVESVGNSGEAQVKAGVSGGSSGISGGSSGISGGSSGISGGSGGSGGTSGGSSGISGGRGGSGGTSGGSSGISGGSGGTSGGSSGISGGSGGTSGGSSGISGGSGGTSGGSSGTSGGSGGISGGSGGTSGGSGGTSGGSGGISGDSGGTSGGSGGTSGGSGGNDSRDIEAAHNMAGSALGEASGESSQIMAQSHVRKPQENECHKDGHTIECMEKRIGCNPEGITVHKNRTPFEQQDLLVPWHLRDKKGKAKDKIFFRYYHVFVKGELETLCETVGEITVVDSYYDQGNWCVIFKKL